MENATNDFNVFKDRMLAYNTIAQVLHKSEDIEVEQDLLEEAMDAESDILKSFGLRGTTENRGMIDLFCWAGDFEDADIEKFHRKLITTAEDYLSAPVKGDIAFLMDSKGKHLTAFDVLPELGIDTIVYNVFLYESLFYCQDYPADGIFEDMKKGNTIPGDVTKNMIAPLLFQGALDHEIAGIGLKFWDQFKEYEKSVRNPEKYIGIMDFLRNRTDTDFPDSLCFAGGYVSMIKLMPTDAPSVCVEIMVNEIDLGWLNIYVYMPFDDVLEMLKKSSDMSVASVVRSMLFEKLKGNPFVTDVMTIRESYKTYLSCEGLDWTVTKMELEDDNGATIEHHNYYELMLY